MPHNPCPAARQAGWLVVRVFFRVNAAKSRHVPCRRIKG